MRWLELAGLDEFAILTGPMTGEEFDRAAGQLGGLRRAIRAQVSEAETMEHLIWILREGQIPASSMSFTRASIVRAAEAARAVLWPCWPAIRS